MNGNVAQVLSGLEPGDRLIEHPSSRIEDGVQVRARERRTVAAPTGADAADVDVQLTASWEDGSGGCAFLVH